MVVLATSLRPLERVRKARGVETGEWERRIDELVYQLSDLAEVEIAVIEER